MFRSLIWPAILFNTSISRYVKMCHATNNSTPIHCVKRCAYSLREKVCIRTAYGSEIILYSDTFHAVTARGYSKII